MAADAHLRYTAPLTPPNLPHDTRMWGIDPPNTSLGLTHPSTRELTDRHDEYKYHQDSHLDSRIINQQHQDISPPTPIPFLVTTMLSTASVLLALLPLALTSPIDSHHTKPAPVLRFGAIAARSTAPFHLQTINASDYSFWIGKDTTTYCPLEPASSCPPGNQTVLVAGNGGGASMDTNVPGGQSVYVAPNGKLSYTIAHSASIPPGSAVKTFTATIPPATVDNSYPLGSFNFKGLGATGFLACPSHKVDSEEGPFPYQVFADVKALSDKDVPSGSKQDCLGFSAVIAEYKGAPTWQYD
ncbi:MAG: hypothetical protein Q9168_004813 [Polycauliona sp. 1 TL-2023]